MNFVVNYLKQTLPGAGDVLWPRHCAVCGAAVGREANHLCWDCRAQAVVIREPYCTRCGDPVEGLIDDAYTCYQCNRVPVHFDRARSAVRYEGPWREALQAFKYRGALWLEPDLLAALEQCLNAHFADAGIDAVTCVPLYRSKARERGYNQAAVLADALARRMKRPMAPRALRRVRPTPSQTRLTAAQRAANVRGAFTGRTCRHTGQRRLLLIDDVMTTGATVNECARVLKKEAGASYVAVLTVARG